MVNELERLLSNSHAPGGSLCFSSVVLMKDNTTFGGAIVKNDIFRDAIYAEQIAIARAVTAGYKKGDFEAIYIMVGSNSINDLKYINKDMILEFFEPQKEVFLYDLNRNLRIIKVGNLFENIY